jgi:glycosyltransferase 2 family protein
MALKRTALLILKILVSLALLAYLFTKTDTQALVTRVRNGDTLLLALAALLYLLVIGLSTWRWGLLIKAQGYPAPLRQLSASYLVATFFNNFLPSNIGGDLIRVRDGKQLTGSTTSSLAIVAIDRILGFGALYMLAVVAFALAGPQARQLAGARVILLGLALVFGSIAYVYFRPGTAGGLMQRTGLNRLPWLRERFETVQSAVHVYRAQMGSVWLAFASSVALQMLLVLYYFFVAKALGILLPFSACFLMIPLCSLIQAVPISFNGWGVREGVFIVYFGQVGLARDSALAFSLLGAGLIVLLSLSGALVWTTRSRFPDSAPCAGDE